MPIPVLSCCLSEGTGEPEAEVHRIEVKKQKLADCTGGSVGRPFSERGQNRGKMPYAVKELSESLNLLRIGKTARTLKNTAMEKKVDWINSSFQPDRHCMNA